MMSTAISVGNATLLKPEPQTSSWWRTLDITVVLVITALSLLYVSSAGRYWNIAPDSATYVIAAKTLAAGNGYLKGDRPAELFPPATSLIFGGLLFLNPSSYFALNLAIKCFVLLSMVNCFFILKNLAGARTSGAIIVVCLASIAVFQLTRFLLSDYIYMFFSTLALALAITRKPDAGLWWQLWIAALVLAASMTRLVGVALALGFLLPVALTFARRGRMDWVKAASMFVSIGAVMGWEFRNSLVGMSYTRGFFQKVAWVDEDGHASVIDIAQRVRANLAEFPSTVSILSNDLISTSVAPYIAALLIPAIAFGLFLGLRRKSPEVAAYVVAYMAILMIVFPGGERYIIPVLPLLLYYGLTGLIEAAKFLRIPARLVQIMAILCLVQFTQTGARTIYGAAPEQRVSPFEGVVKYPLNYDLQGLGVWLKHNSRPDETFIDQHPELMAFITERKGYRFPFSHDVSQFTDLLKKRPSIHFVFVDKNKDEVRAFLIPAIEALPDRFSLIKDEKNASLYAVK